jgi:hypothetical protein
MRCIWSRLLCSSLWSTTEPRKKKKKQTFLFFKVLAGLTRLTRTLRPWALVYKSRTSPCWIDKPNWLIPGEECQYYEDLHHVTFSVLKLLPVPKVRHCWTHYWTRSLVSFLHLLRSICFSISQLNIFDDVFPQRLTEMENNGTKINFQHFLPELLKLKHRYLPVAATNPASRPAYIRHPCNDNSMMQQHSPWGVNFIYHFVVRTL